MLILCCPARSRSSNEVCYPEALSNPSNVRPTCSIKSFRRAGCRMFTNLRTFSSWKSLSVSRRLKDHSVDVVLFPVEGGVGLDDDVFVRGLLEFIHEQGLAGL